MALPEPIPQVRVVRNAGQLVAPPPAPRRPPGPLLEQARTVLAVALGLWPLTGAVLLMLALLYFAGTAGAP
jgi:hypothetical protein